MCLKWFILVPSWLGPQVPRYLVKYYCWVRLWAGLRWGSTCADRVRQAASRGGHALQPSSPERWASGPRPGSQHWPSWLPGLQAWARTQPVASPGSQGLGFELELDHQLFWASAHWYQRVVPPCLQKHRSQFLTQTSSSRGTCGCVCTVRCRLRRPQLRREGCCVRVQMCIPLASLRNLT